MTEIVSRKRDFEERRDVSGKWRKSVVLRR